MRSLGGPLAGSLARSPAPRGSRTRGAAATWLPRSPALLALVALLFGTLGLSFVAGGVARPLFVLGSAVVGYLAWREGCGRSIEVALSLYVFAPFLRRLVDVAVGYDPSSVMLVGPVLAIAVPVVELRHLLVRREPEDSDLLPFVLVGLCITYGMVLSAFMGELASLATSALKMYAPLLYGVWVTREARRDPEAVVNAMIRTFLVLAPIIGAYGVWQYVNPSDWDRYWMLNVSSGITVLGRPEPFQVRVFSMMNSPASFGTYAACGVLLYGFCRGGWKALPFAALVGAGLLFTYYRTAWISLALGIGYCALFNRTRGRAGLISATIVIGLVLAAGSADFGDAIMQRLDTFTGSVSDDGSGKARLGQIFETYRVIDELGLGFGFAQLSQPLNGVEAIDGELVTAMVAMGVFGGTAYLIGLVWAGAQALSRIGGDADAGTIVVGAVIVGMLSAIPLTGITSGEIGLLFWLFVALATARPKPARRRRVAA